MPKTKLTIAQQKKLLTGVRRITVNYSGGGDSECIDEITTVSTKGKQRELSGKQKDFVEDRMYNLLNELPDWCNNDGGKGTATVTLSTNVVKIEHTTFSSDDCARSVTLSPPPAITKALTKLPKQVVSLWLSYGAADNRVLLIDGDGREVAQPAEQLLDCFGQYIDAGEALAEPGEAEEDSTTWELDVTLPLAGDLNWEISWSERTSHDGQYEREFFVDGTKHE